MKVWTSPVVLGVAGLLLVVYLLLFSLSEEGYGYAGHGGYHRSASFWYWGGVNTNHERSVRAGSRGGPGVRGGGLHGGK